MSWSCHWQADSELHIANYATNPSLQRGKFALVGKLTAEYPFLRLSCARPADVVSRHQQVASITRIFPLLSPCDLLVARPLDC